MSIEEIFNQVLEKAQKKMIGPDGQPHAKGWNRQILYYFSDVEEYWMMQVNDGRPEQPIRQAGKVEKADVHLTLSSETLARLVNGRLNILQALLGGQVAIVAGRADLEKLRQLI